MIFASVPESNALDFGNEVLAAIGKSPLVYTNVYSYGVLSSIVMFFFVYYSTIFNDEELPLNVRLANYQRIQSIMLQLQGISSIIKSFAQPLPITTQNDGLCQFAYNLLLPTGKMTRVVFGQNDLLFKKK